ncbi:DUF4301 family protein [Aureisphaera galaxeae]|uniref:DUF4301 family protein n=1 Tax=Aureisphaera galaxeae TaxID=1538023 RepID=UPI00235106B8|nr:DUF4301 family protein [Aureisphaera galaxeae]MDC8002749.1 DUF4301 family protein [Aureisphaera galaxeae]
MLTEKDIDQIETHGLTLHKVYKQLETFNRGIPFANVITTASIGNGIQEIDEKERKQLEHYFDEKKDDLDIVKFVPASGAATRMFKFLHEFLESFDPEKDVFRTYAKKNPSEDLETFFSSLSEFAFVNEVRKKIREMYPDYKKSSKGQRYHYFVNAMLSEEGLNFGNKPKGLVPFHRYKKYATTAFEEQLIEAASYSAVKDDIYLHFTFSENHVDAFKEEFNAVKSRVSRKTKKTYHISYSFQNKDTDTIAVDPDNKPFRNTNGKLVFRPSGHGALLKNLNDVNADIIFIKNIDNVASQEYNPEIGCYKKVLAGKLLQLQSKIFGYLKKLEGDITLEEVKEIQSFVWNDLDVKDIPHGISAMTEFLNRPIRVCGVVRNTGAPGGGPFWVKNVEGQVSLQIVEKSQIDMDNERQRSIVNEATHFNPVDIVCGLRDYKGEKFDLMQFADPYTGIISEKSESGKPIRALELPGLWNGGMAQWNTVFVEVPLITFNPVKTVNDLLKKEHRPNA